MSSTMSPFAIIDTLGADRVDRGEATRAMHMLEAEVTLHHEIALIVGGQRLMIPADVSHLILSTYRLLAAGRGVVVGTGPETATVAAEEQGVEITTGDAAQLLGVSRPHVIELIKRRVLRSRPKSSVPGSHRCVRKSDVLAYKRQLMASVSTLAALEQAADEIDLDEVYEPDTARTR